MSGLTPGLLRVIHKQVGHQTKVTQAVLADKWRGVCLSQVRDGQTITVFISPKRGINR